MILLVPFYHYCEKKEEVRPLPLFLHLLTTARRSCHFPTMQPTYGFNVSSFNQSSNGAAAIIVAAKNVLYISIISSYTTAKGCTLSEAY